MLHSYLSTAHDAFATLPSGSEARMRAAILQPVVNCAAELTVLFTKWLCLCLRPRPSAHPALDACFWTMPGSALPSLAEARARARETESGGWRQLNRFNFQG